jgi:diguanylate cyclase (GGDEF)-like protein
MQFTKPAKLPRLTARYKRLATIAGIAAVLIAVISTWYVAGIKQGSAESLQYLRNIKKLSAQIRNLVVDTELKLSNLLLSSSIDDDISPVDALDQAILHSRELQQLTAGRADFDQELSSLTTPLQSYRQLLVDLLERRKDLNWLYPALPYINGSMLDANQQFETANLLAINELKEESDNPYSQKGFQYFYETNDLWRRIILNFRAMLIRFSGLQNVPLGASAEEQNILLLYEELDSRMQAIAALGKEGSLSFQGEEALTEMRAGSAAWKEGFEQMRQMRLSIYWRADTEYMNTRIKPVQETILTKLATLEALAETLSHRELSVVEKVLDRLAVQFWIIAIFIILGVIMGYSYMQKLILRPVARVAEALWAESHGKTPAKLSTARTMEMKQLIESFSAMRKQVTERQQALEYQALHDSLTSLPNRVLLNDRLEQQINQASREDSTLALLIMDLNGFKEINDTLGHQIGDQVLVSVAERIQEQVRTVDTVARMGGDEFAVLLADVDKDATVVLVKRIVKSLESHLEIGGHKLHISASIGITLFPDHGHNAKILVQRADVAMYMAKRSHTPYMFYDREQDTHNIGWLTMPAELEVAIKKDQLELYYQPKVETLSGQLTGVEALLRWQHPRHGWVNPEDIVELAESSALIAELTSWVIDKALGDCMRWRESGVRLNMAVNLSPQNLHDPGFVDQVSKALARHAMNGDALTLEITENAFISDPAQAVTTIRHLKSMGIRIAIDDYGTGFSSLSYLRQLAVNELKIDKVFVMNLHQNNDDVTIVRSTIHMAQSLGLQVVAEGVETVMSLQLLRELECDFLQGYLISEPLSDAQFLAWLDDWEGYQSMDADIGKNAG